MTHILRNLALTGAGAALALGAGVAPAQASTSDPVLVASAYQGGACSGAASVRWNRASDSVRVDSRVHSAYAFKACRLAVVLTWSAQGYTIGQVTHNLPTACALTDPVCPSTVYETWRGSNFVAPFARPFTDTVTAELVGRPR